MREFKFRAWNIILKRFQYFTFSDIESQKSPIQWQILKIQQAIGVKDREGNDIYEGDLVEAWSQGSKGTFEIKYRNQGCPSFMLFPAWQNGEMWHISATEHRQGKTFISAGGEVSATKKEGFFDDGLKVIGNIFQNPDLIKNRL